MAVKAVFTSLLCSLLISAVQENKLARLKKKLLSVLSTGYIDEMKTNGFILRSIDILRVDTLTEKRDSIYSNRLVKLKINKLTKNIELRLAKLDRSSLFIQRGKELSAQLYNDALIKGELELNKLERIMRSFSALTNRSQHLNNMINSNKLDSTASTGYIVLLNLHMQDNKRKHLVIDSVEVTFNSDITIKRKQLLKCHYLDSLLK